MQRSKSVRLFLAVSMLLPLSQSAGQSGVAEIVELNAFTVYAGSQSIQGSSASQLSERMAREARVDLQSRGGERYQTDISIRGGIFEGSGLMLGGLALFDPQTGHYFSEIPLDPAFFGGAYLLTGVENGIHGFNSTAGTINWQWSNISPGAALYARIGTNQHYGAGLRVSEVMGEGSYEISLTHEQGDGSINFSDFDLTRLSGRVEYQLGDARVRLFGGFLEKFYGWPGMYTGFALNETDAYTVGLLGGQLEWTGRDGRSGHRIGGYWRQVDDDYEFRRESPNSFFEHKTEVFSIQGDGAIGFNQTELIYRWSWLADRIARSTSLVNGDFNQRKYGEASVLARQRFDTIWGDWALYGGASVDTSNEDSTVGSPLAGLRTTGISDGVSWTAYFEYAESTRVPGYTVLNSAPTGLFGGNKNLGRETASVAELGYSFQSKSVSGKIVLFHRIDDRLVDWVYQSGTPNARQAAPVDMDVTGLESWFRWESTKTAFELGYMWINKDATYLEPGIDASFYALNYARHRLLATWEQELSDTLLLRLEAEARQHPDNVLRAGGDEAFRLNAEITWRAAFHSDWDLLLRGMNLTGDDFQMLPGTPGPGKEIYLTMKRDW